MGRRKKLTETELENTQTTLTIEDSNQAESEEAKLLAETDSEVVSEEAPVEEEAEVIAEEVVAEEPVKKPRKPRKPRAKKVEVEAASTKTEENPAEDKLEVQGPLPGSNELDQWAAIKQLSESVSQILEHTHKLQSPPPSLDINTDEFLRPQPQTQKTLFITKFATAASIVAILLSLVSLSLSQSARQAALGALEPLKQSNLGIAAKPSTGEEALPFRRSPRRNR